MGIEPIWRYLPGGVCAYGDRARPVTVPTLYWSTTPVTRAQLGKAGDGDVPVTGLDHDEACEAAASLGGRLPRSVEWEWMAAGGERRRFPWGDADWTPAKANLRPSGQHGPTPVCTHPEGATPGGLLDVAGNVWEWTASPSLGGGAIIRGGSYHSLPLYATCRFLNAAPRELRSPGIGFRVVREP